MLEVGLLVGDGMRQDLEQVVKEGGVLEPGGNCT
jgi:hypothetical protein